MNPYFVSQTFKIANETSNNRKLVKETIKRFKELSQTYEFMIKFNMNVEKTEESSISMTGNTPGEIVDQKERRRYLRKEM